MFLKFQITCTCHNKYTINEKATVESIICPNCGLEYPHSDKVLNILHTAAEIPDTNSLNDKECDIRVISLDEDMTIG